MEKVRATFTPSFKLHVKAKIKESCKSETVLVNGVGLKGLKKTIPDDNRGSELADEKYALLAGCQEQRVLTPEPL